MQHRQLPVGWDKDLPTFAADTKGMATRDASGKLLNAIGKNVPWLIGGSADLGPSCKSRLTFDGTAVAAGEATAVVVATGPDTEARRSAHLPGAEPPPSGLEARLRF